MICTGVFCLLGQCFSMIAGVCVFQTHKWQCSTAQNVCFLLLPVNCPHRLCRSSLSLRIEIPFKFHMMHSGLVHGLAFWFDVAFIGSS